MKKHRMPEVKEGNVNVTPLIDIVMCLIIFFMLVAKIGVSTGAEQMDLPQTVLGAKIEDMGNTLTLNVREIHGVELPLITALVQGRQQELKLVDPTTGKRPLVEVLTAMRKANKDFKVIIRGAKDLPYRLLEPVLINCAEANVKNVNFNTRIGTTEAPAI